MDETARFLFDQGLAETTRKRYDAVWKRYSEWCTGLMEAPLPVTEAKATGYVVTLTCEGLQAGSIKHHLAGLRQGQVKAGLPAPMWKDMAKLEQIRKGIARNSAINGKEALQRDPVKWHHMQAMQVAWEKAGDKGVMLWAAACLCFFGCLRAGEALAPEKGEFDPKAHLGWDNVELEDIKSPSKIRVRIKESKTDRLRKGAFVTLGRGEGRICPVKALLNFMVIRKAGPGPFFVDARNRGLTRKVFVEEVKKALVSEGMSDKGISGHSFRIGAAMTAALNGATDEEVKALGRWRSREYKGYIRAESEMQAASAKKLTGTQKRPGEKRNSHQS